MTSRFLAKVLYTAQLPNGAFERKIEQLVFEALTYTDCEAAVYKYMESVTRAEFTIMKIDRFQVDTYWASPQDVSKAPFFLPKTFFLAKTERVNLDDVTIKERILITCNSIEGARQVAEDVASSNGAYQVLIKSIVETKITDYIYAEPDEN